MTIEIRQLIIRALVDSNAAAATAAPPLTADAPGGSLAPMPRNLRQAPLSPTERAAVAADCARTLTRELRRARER
ncbi:MAG TPA: DUF5908 family protein [Polyangiaceae bacterium]|nr:DUF5908 family protein [Polyangiaceae bacterium]